MSVNLTHTPMTRRKDIEGNFLKLKLYDLLFLINETFFQTRKQPYMCLDFFSNILI